MPGFQNRLSSILGRAIALPSHTRGGSRMRESRPYGSVRGAHDETRVPTATACWPHVSYGSISTFWTDAELFWSSPITGHPRRFPALRSRAKAIGIRRGLRSHPEHRRHAEWIAALERGRLKLEAQFARAAPGGIQLD